MTEAFTSTIEIQAPPETVFRHFVEPERLVRWMGDYARLEAVDGGIFSVDINGVLIRGHFIALEPARRIEIAWGEAGNAKARDRLAHISSPGSSSPRLKAATRARTHGQLHQALESLASLSRFPSDRGR